MTTSPELDQALREAAMFVFADLDEASRTPDDPSTEGTAMTLTAPAPPPDDEERRDLVRALFDHKPETPFEALLKTTDKETDQ